MRMCCRRSGDSTSTKLPDKLMRALEADSVTAEAPSADAPMPEKGETAEDDREPSFREFIERWYWSVDWNDQSLLMFRPDDYTCVCCPDL